MPEGDATRGRSRPARPGLAPHNRHRLTITLPPIEEARVQLTAGRTVFTSSCPIAKLGESVPIPLPYDNVGAAAGPSVRLDMERDATAGAGGGGFTGEGGTYPVERLPPAGPFTSRRFTFA